MPQLFGKRPRSGRAASLKSVSFWERLVLSLKDRSVLLRLMIALLGIAGFLFAVRGWKPLFPYREGDRLERGIVARVDFKEVNRVETERAIREAESLVPFMFRQDAAPLKALPSRLRNHLREVVEASSPADLPPDVQRAFQLSPVQEEADPAGGSDSEESPEKRFQDLRAAFAETENVGELLDQIKSDFEQFLEPLRGFGVLGAGETAYEELAAPGESVPLDHAIEITQPDVTDSAEQPEVTSATLADVILAETMKDTGRLGLKWTSFPRLSGIRTALEDWMSVVVPGTLHFDAETTQDRLRVARENAEETAGILHASGEVLVSPGTVIDADQVRLLRFEHDTVAATTPVGNRVLRSATSFLMFAVLAALFAAYLLRSQPELARSPVQLAVFTALCVGTVWIARLVSVDPWRAEIIPLLAAVMVLAIAYDQVLATLCAFVLSLIISIATVATLEHFVVLMAVSIVAIVPLKGVSSRSDLIKTGFLVAAACFVVTWAAGILGQREDIQPGDWQLLMNALRGAGWCLVCCYLVSGTMPFIESRFGIITDISLLELSDISHPLLQELVRRAPGTYNHSIAVATIGEAAAESIGANGLLLRVGAYFHDIGKMLKPEYFIENNTAGEGNRHESLAPAMSTLIIIGHVKDGLELAHEHNLPTQIVDFIEQHHGTTLVEYFFHEATKQADEDHKSEAEESSFRYPGPKPQTKEAGIMMLTDAVESASRTLSEPTPKRIETLVHNITMKRLHDGQFDECNLTLAEIHTIEDSLTKSLIAIHHGRVKYPEQRTA